MGRGLIKRIFRLLTTGGKRTKDADVTDCERTGVRVSVKGRDIYDNIMRAEVESTAGEDIDLTIVGILSVIEDSEDDLEEVDPAEKELRGKIIAICNEILAEQDQHEKMEKISELLSVSSGITAIALFTIRLKEMTGL